MNVFFTYLFSHLTSMRRRPRTGRFAAAAESYAQNIAAISAELHAHPRYGAYYEAFADQINGFVGVYELCISMAAALTDWELDHGGLMAYENRGVTWIEVVECFVDEMLERSLAAGGALVPATVLREIDVLADPRRNVNEGRFQRQGEAAARRSERPSEGAGEAHHRARLPP